MIRRRSLCSLPLSAAAFLSGCCFTAGHEGDGGTSGVASASGASSAGSSGSAVRSSTTGAATGGTSTSATLGTSAGSSSGSAGTTGGSGSTSGGSTGGVPPACPATFGPFPADAGCVTSVDCRDPTTSCQGGACSQSVCTASPDRPPVCNSAAISDGTCIISMGGGAGVGCFGSSSSCLQGGDAGQYCCATADRSTPPLLCPAGQICVPFPGENLGMCQLPCALDSQGENPLPCPPRSLCIPLVCGGYVKSWFTGSSPGACYADPSCSAGQVCSGDSTCGVAPFPTELLPCSGSPLTNGNSFFGACQCPMACDIDIRDGLCEYPCEPDGGCPIAGRVCFDAGGYGSFCKPPTSCSLDAGCPTGQGCYAGFCLPGCQRLADCPVGAWSCYKGACL